MTHKRAEIVIYVSVYLALLVLLGLTVEAARHDLGRWNFLVAMLIAVSKAALIALVFMHLRQSTPLVWLVVCASVMWVTIMFSLSLADYWTRDWDSSIGDTHQRSRAATSE